jgi:ribosomal protein L11 methylase PrmA
VKLNNKKQPLVLVLHEHVFDTSHNSSQLMLDWLTGCASGWIAGRRILDYGCGSGVLGLSALKCGAESVVAVDLSRQALAATHVNAEANNFGSRVMISFPPCEGREQDFDDFFGDFEAEWLEKAREHGVRDIPSLPRGCVEEQRFGCVLANMRKNALVRNAKTIVDLCEPGGVIVVSGFMVDFEERAVLGAFRDAGLQCQINFDAPSVATMGDFRARGGYGLFWAVKAQGC